MVWLYKTGTVIQACGEERMASLNPKGGGGGQVGVQGGIALFLYFESRQRMSACAWS